MINNTPYGDLVNKAVAAYKGYMNWDNVTVVMSSRIRVAAGRCCYLRKADRIRVELCTSIFAKLTDEQRYVIISHEMAHAICFRTNVGKNHDGGWARVDRSMGGTGSRTHSHDVITNIVKRHILLEAGTGKLAIVKTNIYNKFKKAWVINSYSASKYSPVGTIECDRNTKTYRWSNIIEGKYKDAEVLAPTWKMI